MFYSFRWTKLVSPIPLYHRSKRKVWSPVIQIQTSFLNEEGIEVELIRLYEDWIGVCTNNIDNVIKSIQERFPKHKQNIRYEKLCDSKKILPYFEDRLKRGNLDYRTKPFYKVYTNACHEDIGDYFHKYKIGYFKESDWRVRLYLDLCTRYNTYAFYYKWYDINPNTNHNSWLLDSYTMRPKRTDTPDWTIGAFDIETVPLNGRLDRVPTGVDPHDVIVMISLLKWNRRKGIQKFVLYLKPHGLASETTLDQVRVYAYETERDLLTDFHILIDKCQVLTGYNINGYDLPCIFARLLWLRMGNVLVNYSSTSAGESIIATYQHKIIVDLYNYFKTFSGYDLYSYKLDDVAKIKLGNDTSKVAVKSTGIWNWYTSASENVARVIQNDNSNECFNELRPTHVQRKEFGTFGTYLDYCMQDSNLVHLLFCKEDVLMFLVERANFTSVDVSIALYTGPSRFLFELFKAFCTRLGFFFNCQFFKNPVELDKFKSTFVHSKNQETYQGALNYCIPGTSYLDVVVMDFMSMYPSALLSSNLCYGTCTILTRDEWLEAENKYPAKLTAIPYRTHTDKDFEQDNFEHYARDTFSYPKTEDSDDFVMVVNQKTEAFLPLVVKHFIQKRQYHQREYKRTRDVYHKNAQLCIKIMINSLYGVMANKDSILSYNVVAMSIVTLARYQLLGSYHYLSRMNYEVCYVDTDSLMVQNWPDNDCNIVNQYLNLQNVELKYEQRMKCLLVLSKKRYIYETQDGKIMIKGFQKKVNDLIKLISEAIVLSIWQATFKRCNITSAITYIDCENREWLIWTLQLMEDDELSSANKGWCLWVNVLFHIQYMCANPTKFAIYRKTRALHLYKSRKCAAVRILEKHPEKANDYIEYTYSIADVFSINGKNWVMDAHECYKVNTEKLFISQKKTFISLLNAAFLKEENESIVMAVDAFIKTGIRWKQITNADILHKKQTNRRLVILVRRNKQYTLKINDHLLKRKKNAKRKCSDVERDEELEDRMELDDEPRITWNYELENLFDDEM